MSDVFKVVTPENIELEYETAGIGSRFLALMIDSLVQLLFSGAIISILTIFGLDDFIDSTVKMRDLRSSFLVGLLVILAFAISFLYFIILEIVMNGQTVGKKILNIRVRKDQGNAPSFWDILLRNFIRLIDFLPFFYGIGLVVMFLNTRSKRLGDYAAGTIVVKEMPRRKIKKYLTQDLGFKSIVPQEPHQNACLHEHPWLNQVLPVFSQQDYLMIKNLFSRKKELHNFNELSHAIVQKLCAKASMDRPDALTPEEAVSILKEMILQYEKTYLMND